MYMYMAHAWADQCVETKVLLIINQMLLIINQSDKILNMYYEIKPLRIPCVNKGKGIYSHDWDACANIVK